MKARREPVTAEAAPAAIGPYSQAVKAGGFLYCSGQIGIDPATGELVSGGVAVECHQVMRNLAAVLTAAGLDWRDVVRTTIYLTRLEEFTLVNDAYGSYLSAPHPARATVGVAALPKGACVEIDAVAQLRSI
ncbi:MAG: RidA family protein [Candidatus Binatia bacterium]